MTIVAYVCTLSALANKPATGSDGEPRYKAMMAAIHGVRGVTRQVALDVSNMAANLSALANISRWDAVASVLYQ